VRFDAGCNASFGVPLDVALAWQDGGAQWVHLVDLDAAFGRGSNRELITEVVGRLQLRTTNPIESTFSTVKLRTRGRRGAGSAAAALAMVFKLVESAQARWRAITGAHLFALVRAGVRFERGIRVEREEVTAA